jgi:hypothetical protein
MAFQDLKANCTCDIPYSNASVIAGGSKVKSLRRKSDAIDPVSMTSEYAEEGSCRHIP